MVILFLNEVYWQEASYLEQCLKMLRLLSSLVLNISGSTKNEGLRDLSFNICAFCDKETGKKRKQAIFVETGVVTDRPR